MVLRASSLLPSSLVWIRDTKTQPARSHSDNAHHLQHGQIPGGGKCYWKPPETCAGEMLIENRKSVV